MALIVKLAENAAATHEDKLTLKVETETIASTRHPIVIPLPGGAIIGIDWGRIGPSLTIDGIVDYRVSELFVDTIGGTPPFQVGETITGQAAWNGTVTGGSNAGTIPYSRTNTATAIVRAGIPNLTNPTTLIVDSWSSTAGVDADDFFFVNNETITGGTSNATALVNEPLPSKRRLEQIIKYFYYHGAMTLTLRDGNYSVQIKAPNIQLEAGKEDRYRFKITFVQVA